MAQLHGRDYERMLDLAVAVLENDATESAWHLVTGHLLEAMGCDSATFSVVDVAEGTGRIEGWAPARIGRFVGDLVPRRVRQHHPLLAYTASGAHAPVTVSEICDGWRQTQWYQEARRDFGVTQQLGLPVSGSSGAPGTVRLVLMGRDGRFRTHDLAFAARVQPLLATVGNHVQELNRLRGSAPALTTDHPSRHGLTPRELTVLGLLAEGLTALGIARRLAISPSTVNRHLEKIYRKLGTNNRVSTVLLAQEAGLVPARAGSGGATSALPASVRGRVGAP
ncbi:LuxR C-terminal-related transcriptional regulator [Streptomyces sp. NPDC053048]|uniref:helix-turn-helix transcriptional regulator n=1 Tax=Streptomyces sp. NPDC053048 TaxID=3365694 RepID=UPI0037D96960